jgi:hypothetical protein
LVRLFSFALGFPRLDHRTPFEVVAAVTDARVLLLLATPLHTVRLVEMLAVIARFFKFGHIKLLE